MSRCTCGYTHGETDGTTLTDWEPVRTRCPACEAIELDVASLREDSGSIAGIKVSVERRR